MMLDLLHALLALAAFVLPLLLAWGLLGWGRAKPPTKPPGPRTSRDFQK